MDTHTAPPAASLDEIRLLDGVPADVLANLHGNCQWREFKENQIVFEQDDPGNSVFFVVKGRLRVMDFMGEEQQVSLADLSVGDTFGELAAVDLRARSARVTALEPTLLAEISSEGFHDLLLACPSVTFALLKQFASVIRELTSRVTVMSTLSPHQRIYHELIRLAEPDTGEEDVWIIVNAPNHAELSSWVGTDKQTVADAIGSLARSGILERKHKNFLIKDHARLQRLAQQ